MFHIIDMVAEESKCGLEKVIKSVRKEILRRKNQDRQYKK